MKRISLFILLAITAANICDAMANNAKINPAVAVVANKMQSKPILFFDVYALDDKYQVTAKPSQTTVSTRIARGRSLELNDLNDKSNELCEIYNKASNEKEREKAQNERVLFGKEFSNFYNKVNKIFKSIAKRLNASAVLKYNSFDINPSNATFGYIDPAYDITDEVIDTLNKEYKESQGEKPKCNHCGIHCPHKQ